MDKATIATNGKFKADEFISGYEPSFSSHTDSLLRVSISIKLAEKGSSRFFFG